MRWRSNGVQFILALLCWLVSAPVLAAPTVVQFKHDASATPWVTDGIAELTFDSNLTVGNTVCVGSVVEGNRTLSTIVDNGSTSNSYSIPSNGSLNDGNASVFMRCTVVEYAASIVTVTLSSATAAAGHIFGVEFSGAAATDPTVGTQLANATGTTHTIPTLTITGANPVLWGFGFATGTEVWTIDATYTQQYNASNLVVGYKAVTASDDMANTTATNALTRSILVEIVEAASASVNFFTRRLQVNP